MASRPWARSSAARNAWIALLALTWVTAAALLTRGTFALAAWADRPGEQLAAGASSTPPAQPAAEGPPAPELLTQAGLDTQAVAAAGAASSPSAYQTGGRLPGACKPPAWSVVLSASAINQEQGIQSTAMLTSPGGGPHARQDAIAQADACPGTWQQAADSNDQIVIVHSSGRSWAIGQDRDWVAVATYLPPADSQQAIAAVQAMLATARTLPRCAGSDLEQVDFYDQRATSPAWPATYWTAWIDPSWPVMPSLPAGSTDPAPLPDPAASPEPVVTDSMNAGEGTPDMQIPSVADQPLPTPSPIATLAPLLAPEAGGDGIARGPAPILVDPADLPARPGAKPPAPGPSPTPPAPLDGQVNVPEITYDPVGPGCGWNYLGVNIPPPPSAQQSIDARLAAYQDAARRQSRTWADSLNWQERSQAWQQNSQNVQQWRDYGQARRDAVAAWQAATTAWTESQARWQTAGTPAASAEAAP